MKKLLSLAAFLLVSCNTSPPPTPATQASTVYWELVDAGCMAPAPDGLASIAEEHARSDQPAWLVCLFDGGSVGSCSAPCQ
jgi:hypothetical protein